MPKITVTDETKRKEMCEKFLKDRRHKYYESKVKASKLECAACCKMVHKYYMHVHETTATHIKCVALMNQDK